MHPLHMAAGGLHTLQASTVLHREKKNLGREKIVATVVKFIYVKDRREPTVLPLS